MRRSTRDKSQYGGATQYGAPLENSYRELSILSQGHLRWSARTSVRGAADGANAGELFVVV